MGEDLSLGIVVIYLNTLWREVTPCNKAHIDLSEEEKKEAGKGPETHSREQEWWETGGKGEHSECAQQLCS